LAFTQQLAARFVATALSFSVVSLSSRYYGPENFGQLTAALAFVGLFAAFSDFGVNVVVARRGAQEGGLVDRFVGQSAGLTIGYSIPLGLLVTVTALMLYGADTSSLAWYVIGLLPYLLLQSLASSYIPLFQASHDFRWFGAAEVLSALVTLVGMAGISALDCGIWAYILVVDIAAAVRLVLVVLGARKHGEVRPRFAVAKWRSLLKESWQIGLTSVIGVVYYRADTILLSLLSSNYQVGLYGLAYRIVGVISTIPSLLVTSSFYSVSGSVASRHEFKTHATRLLSRTLVLVTPLTVGGVLAAPEIIRFAGGLKFAEASWPLRLLLIGTAMLCVNTAVGAVLTAMHRQKTVLGLGGFSLIINVGLLIVLVPEAGATGAAWAFVIAEVFSTVCLLPIASSNFDWKNFILDAAPVLLGGFVMCGAFVLFGGDRGVIVSGLLLFAVYFSTYCLAQKGISAVRQVKVRGVSGGL
jgi:O-antigen/teichoic acid export membrane protein